MSDNSCFHNARCQDSFKNKKIRNCTDNKKKKRHLSTMKMGARRRKILQGNVKKTDYLLNMERRHPDWCTKDIYFPTGPCVYKHIRVFGNCRSDCEWAAWSIWWAPHTGWEFFTHCLSAIICLVSYRKWIFSYIWLTLLNLTLSNNNWGN